METTFATNAGASARTGSSARASNEDVVVAGETFAIVLDGATAEPNTDSGCRHGVRWFATQLGSQLASRLTLDTAATRPLADLLYDAIDEVGKSHVDTCDLANLCSPSSTVAIVAQRGYELDYLVLGDSPVLLGRRTADPLPVTDDRLANFVGPWSQLRYARNAPGGFWIAGNTPAAAEHAVVGSIAIAELTSVALLSDGVTRLVERYSWTWQDLLTTLAENGPADLIARTRAHERATPPGRFIGKPHDDATAALCRFTDALS
jgi:hypothetical protein